MKSCISLIGVLLVLVWKSAFASGETSSAAATAASAAGRRSSTTSDTTRELPPALQERLLLHKQQPLMAETIIDDEINSANTMKQSILPNRELLESAESMASQIRSDLLENYDVMTYPFQYMWQQQEQNNQTRNGLPVQVGINIQKVYEVNVKRAAADLVVWFRMAWNDPRLAWDPEQYGGVENIFVYPGTGLLSDDTEIFVPDITLWNQEQGMVNSLSPTSAQLSYNGDIFWSRPGRLKPACKFLGLENFPFDKLECTMEFGSWSYSSKFIRPVLFQDSGIDLGGSVTSGETYADVSLIDAVVEPYSYPPFSQQDSDWPVLLYHLKFKRAWEPYLRGFFIRAIILNCIAFGCFWIPPKFTARLGLAMTSMLAAVAAELNISQRLPVSSTWTFYGKVMVGSMMFTACVIFETVCVTHLDFCTKNDLLPPWYHTLCGKWRHWRRTRRMRQKEKVEKNDRKRDSEEKSLEHRTHHTSVDSIPKSTKEEMNEDNDALVDEPSSAILSPSRTHYTSSEVNVRHSLIEAAKQAVREKTKSNPSHDNENVIDVDEDDNSSHHSQNSFNSHDVHPLDEQDREEAEEAIKELAKLELEQHVPKPEPYDDRPTPSTRLYAEDETTANPDTIPSWKQKLLRATADANNLVHKDESTINKPNTAAGATRASLLWSKLASKLPNQSEIEKMNSKRWRALAVNIDEFCRLFFPVAYLIFISVSIHIARKMESEDDFHSFAEE